MISNHHLWYDTSLTVISLNYYSININHKIDHESLDANSSVESSGYWDSLPAT